MKKIIAIAALTLLAGCGVNAKSATVALEAQGMTNVKIGSWVFFGCGDSDAFRSSFTATGVNGKPVSGIVCSGMLKGVTIRYD